MIRVGLGSRLLPALCLRGRRLGAFLLRPLVVQSQKTLEHFLTCCGADRVADTVVLGQGLDFDEVMAEVQVGPAVGVAHGVIERQQDVDALVKQFIVLA